MLLHCIAFSSMLASHATGKHAVLCCCLLLQPGYNSDSAGSSPSNRIAQDIAEQESQTAPSCTYDYFLKADATASYRCFSIVEVKRLLASCLVPLPCSEIPAQVCNFVAGEKVHQLQC